MDYQGSQDRTEQRERFVKVAERRTKQILKLLRLLGNCSNRSSYEFKPEEIEKIFDRIQMELDMSRARFQIRREIDFSLEE